jgi:transposase
LKYEEAETFKSIVVTSEGEVAKTVSKMVNLRAGDVERWIKVMKQEQMDARVTQRSNAVIAMTDKQAKIAAAKEHLDWKMKEQAALQDDIHLALKTWGVDYQNQIQAELIAMNKLILGTTPPPSAKGAFLNEQFGSGLGVRKDTYLPSISATDRTLRVGEIRGKSELDIYENMK